MWVSLIVIVAAIGILVGFFLYDRKVSKHKIFPVQMMNKSVILTEILLLLSTVC